jgi:hypothetical protein
MAIAFVTAFSTLSGIEFTTDRRERGISVKRFAMIDCGVAPLNGLSPVNIS